MLRRVTFTVLVPATHLPSGPAILEHTVKDSTQMNRPALAALQTLGLPSTYRTDMYVADDGLRHLRLVCRTGQLAACTEHLSHCRALQECARGGGGGGGGVGSR